MSESKQATPISGTPLTDILNAQSGFDQFLDKHQLKLFALALLAAVAAVVLVVVRGIEDGNQKTAGGILSSKADVEGLQALVKDYPETNAANSSKILLAQSQWDDGKQDEAIATLRGLVESGLEHPAVNSARASLAAKLLAKGKAEETEKILAELAEDKNAEYLAAYALLTLGDMALAKGDLAAAEKAYNRVEKDYSGTSYVDQAVSRRLLMKAESPSVVMAPVVLPDTKITKDDEKIEIQSLEDALKIATPEGSLPPGVLGDDKLPQ
jgi:predicted negative regulator of RcsB-dependent stress response